MTAVLYTQLQEPLFPDKFYQYLNYLDDKSQQKILLLRRSHDQHLSVLGKMLLLRGLMKFNYPKELLKEVLYTKYLRPYANIPLDFNISHSGEIAICALSDSCRLGIDVEKLREITIAEFKDVLSIEEYNNISHSGKIDTGFLNIWTRKEAVLKANGAGLNIPLNDIILEDDVALLNDKTWFLREILPLENYCSAIATSVLIKDDLIPEFIRQDELLLG